MGEMGAVGEKKVGENKIYLVEEREGDAESDPARKVAVRGRGERPVKSEDEDGHRPDEEEEGRLHLGGASAVPPGALEEAADADRGDAQHGGRDAPAAVRAAHVVERRDEQRAGGDEEHERM